MYKTPFNDWGFSDNKTLVYDNSVDQEEVQKAIDDAFAEKDQFMKSATYDKDSKKFTFEVGESSVEVDAADMFDGVATSDDINQINTKNEEQDTALSEKANTSDVYTKAEIDEKLEEIDIPDVSDLATKEEVQAVDAKVDAIEIPDVSDFATKEEVEAVDSKVDAIEIPDVSNFATKDEVSETVTTEVAKIVADAPEDFNTLKEIADYIASDKTKADQIETSISNLEENKVDWVESTPGRKHIVLKNHDSVLGTATDGTTYNVAMVSKWDVADFGTSNLHTNLNSKDGVVTINDNKQVATTDELPDVSDFATKAEVAAVDTKVDAIEIPDVSGFAIKSEVTEEINSAVDGLNAAIADKADKTDISDMATQTWVNEQGFLKEHQSLEEYAKIVDVNSALADFEAQTDTAMATKANAEDVYTKTESNELFQESGDYVSVEDYNELLRKFASLENYVNIFIKDREEKMDEIISNMDADNKEVVIETPMESIVVPETNVAYTITAPLADNSTVELTSPKYMTLFNTSEEPVSTSIGHTFVEGESTSATSVYLVGDFDTLTLENVSPSVKSGYDAASVNNVVITENNVKNLTLALDIQDGATITNNSNASITIQDKNDAATTITIVAPNSTVTLNGSSYEEVNATVSDNTLLIKKTVNHIGTLNVSKGNVIVEVPRQSLIAEKIDQYTLAEGYTIDYLHDEINSSNVANLAKEGTHTLVEDVAKSGNFSVGTFSTDDMIWELNGHSITSSNTRGYGIFRLRGSAHLEVNDSVGTGVVRNTDDDYGLWTGTVDSKIVINGGNFEASTHVLYAEKGTIEVNGGTFKLTNWETADKDESGNLRFLINCHDADYVSGDAKIIVRGGKFYDFDPANCAAEGPGTSFVAEGYGSVMTTEMIGGVEHRVYEVKPINE